MAVEDVVVARIETLGVDAVVNAANRWLAPGTGVDGALRAAAGPLLTQATQKLAPIAEGWAVHTDGFEAPARYIIHVAAPVWFGGGEEKKQALLGSCYANALTLADALGAREIAFPCLGTGNFGWPKELACEIALASCRAALARATSIERVIYCCFSEEDAAIYRQRI